jgi:hypothetical protein
MFVFSYCTFNIFAQLMESSLVFLRRALWLVCLSVIVASIAIMESSNASFVTAVSDEHAVHMEGNLCASYSVRLGRR